MPSSQVFYIGGWGYPTSLTLIKLSLLFQYLRLFEIGSRRRLACKCLIVIVSIWGIFFTITTVVPCVPVSSLWDFTSMDTDERHCWGQSSANIAVGIGFYATQCVSTTLLDMIVFLLPVELFFQSDTPRKTRIALLCLFGLGLG